MASKNKEAVYNSQKRNADGIPMTMMGSERERRRFKKRANRKERINARQDGRVRQEKNVRERRKRKEGPPERGQSCGGDPRS